MVAVIGQNKRMRSFFQMYIEASDPVPLVVYGIVSNDGLIQDIDLRKDRVCAFIEPQTVRPDVVSVVFGDVKPVACFSAGLVPPAPSDVGADAQTFFPVVTYYRCLKRPYNR